MLSNVPSAAAAAAVDEVPSSLASEKMAMLQGEHKRRGTATTVSTEMSEQLMQNNDQEEEGEEETTTPLSQANQPLDNSSRFVNVIARKIADDLIQSSKQEKRRGKKKDLSDPHTPSGLIHPETLDVETIAKLIRESVEQATSSHDTDDDNTNDGNHDDENDDHDFDSIDDAPSPSSLRNSSRSHASISGESRASTTSTNSNVSAHSFITGNAPAEEIFHPDFWCADLDETLERLQQQQPHLKREDDDVSEVSNLSEVTGLVASASHPPQIKTPAPESKSKPTTSSHSVCSAESISKKSTTTHKTESQASSSSYQYKVKFKHITVREYTQILGDNPGCTNGPSLAIGWEYQEHPELPVNDFERIRSKHRRPSNNTSVLLMSRDRRETILRRLGYSTTEIADAVRRDNKVRAQRRQTVSNMAMYEALGNTKKMILRGLFPSSSKAD